MRQIQSNKVNSLSLFILTLVLSTISTWSLKALAHEESAGAEGAAHSEHEEKPPLFPQPVANRAKAIRPDNPELVSPAYMAKISGASTVLKWKATEGATNYHLQVATDPNFKWLLVNETQLSATEFTVSNLEAAKHYYWRVFSRKMGNKPGDTKSLGAKSMFQTL